MASTDVNPDTARPTSGALTTVEHHGALTHTLPWPYAVPARPEILTSKPSPTQLLHSLRRRWITAIGLGTLLGATLAAAVWFLVPVNFEAKAYLQVFQNSQGPEIQGAAVTPETDFQNFKRTQAQLMTSPKVILAALRPPDISKLPMVQAHSDDPSGWLADQILVEYPGDAEIMRVSMKGDQPVDLAKLVNAVTEAYIAEIVNQDRLDKVARRDAMQRTYEQYGEDIRKKLVSLNKLAKEFGTDSSTAAEMKKKVALEEINAQLQQISTLQSDIYEKDMDIFRMQAMVKDKGAGGPSDELLEDEMMRDPQIAALTSKLIQLNQALSQLKYRLQNPNAKEIVRMMHEIQGVQEQIDERREAIKPVMLQRFAASGDPAKRLALFELEKGELDKRLKAAQDNLSKQIAKLAEIERYSADIEKERQDLQQLQDLYAKLGMSIKVKDLEILGQDRVISREKATAPTTSNALQKYFAVAFAGLLGFSLVVLGVAFVEFQARRLNSRREIHEGLGLRVLGELPSFAGRAWRRRNGRAAMQAVLAESIDSIRTALIHAGASDVRIVMITSAEPHEGKTTVASQLAGSLARAGKRTLYIDGDLRNPAAHRVFELPQEPGLCDLLRGQVAREAIIQPTPARNLWLMPAGRCSAQSVQALSAGVLEEALSALRKEFDFIVVDSGPVLSVADPLLLGQHADAAIVSVLRDVSQMPKVYDATERLRSVGVTVMGVVVNGSKDKPSRHGYEIELAESA